MRMKSLYTITRLLLLMLLSVLIGCEQPRQPLEIPPKTDNTDSSLSFYVRYIPDKIDIMPLTEFVVSDNTRQTRINIFVSLIDQFGSQVKSPGMFRFELYEYMQRSSEPKGRRAVIWPDIDLTDPVTNNDFWRDFLRAYEFSFPCEQAKRRDYILHVTCMCPNGRRLSSEFILRHTK